MSLFRTPNTNESTNAPIYVTIEGTRRNLLACAPQSINAYEQNTDVRDVFRTMTHASRIKMFATRLDTASLVRLTTVLLNERLETMMYDESDHYVLTTADNVFPYALAIHLQQTGATIPALQPFTELLQRQIADDVYIAFGEDSQLIDHRNPTAMRYAAQNQELCRTNTYGTHALLPYMTHQRLQQEMALHTSVIGRSWCDFDSYRIATVIAVLWDELSLR